MQLYTPIFQIYGLHKDELEKKLKELWLKKITKDFANNRGEYLDEDRGHCLPNTIKHRQDKWYVILEICVEARVLYWDKKFNEIMKAKKDDRLLLHFKFD